MIPPCRLFVCHPLTTLEQNGRFHEIQQEDPAIEGDLYATLFNKVASTIPNG
jgi:hypothetical protein